MPPGPRCCHCHTCTTHRPSYLPLPSVSPGAKVFPPLASCVSGSSARELSHALASCSACVTLLSSWRCPPCVFVSVLCPLRRSGTSAVVLPQAELFCPARGTLPAHRDHTKAWGINLVGRGPQRAAEIVHGGAGPSEASQRGRYAVLTLPPSLLVWQLEPPDSDQEAPSHASVSWIVDPKPDSKRSRSTKYETTIF